MAGVPFPLRLHNQVHQRGSLSRSPDLGSNPGAGRRARRPAGYVPVRRLGSVNPFVDIRRSDWSKELKLSKRAG